MALRNDFAGIPHLAHQDNDVVRWQQLADTLSKYAQSVDKEIAKLRKEIEDLEGMVRRK
jgi:hypothetical protein